jgi:hypothetical protein
MKVRILVPGEPQEADLALLLRFVQCFRGAVGADELLRVVLKAHPMDLPQIEMIGLQSPQRLLQHLHSQRCVPAVSAYLGHQKCVIAHTAQTLSQPVL